MDKTAKRIGIADSFLAEVEGSLKVTVHYFAVRHATIYGTPIVSIQVDMSSALTVARVETTKQKPSTRLGWQVMTEETELLKQILEELKAISQEIRQANHDIVNAVYTIS